MAEFEPGNQNLDRIEDLNFDEFYYRRGKDGVLEWGTVDPEVYHDNGGIINQSRNEIDIDGLMIE